MNRRPIVALASALLALSLSACAGGAMTEPTSGRPPFQTTTPGPIPSPGEPSSTPAEVPPTHWDAIVDDLETRGVTGEPTLVSSEAVTWADGALGCPAPGQSYTQATVDGMRIVVEVDGETYDYRFGASDRPRLCERSLPSSLGGIRSNPRA